MAKRIKVKGKPPRGLSKTQRIKISPLKRKRDKIVSSERNRADPGDVSESTLDAIDRYDYMIDEISERPYISSKPSSTRKKLVKEGNRKFIGPRTRASVESEKADRNRWSEIETRHQAERGERKIRVPEAVELLREGFFYNPGVVPSGPQWGKGGIAKNNRLLGLLLRRLEKAKNKRA